MKPLLHSVLVLALAAGTHGFVSNRAALRTSLQQQPLYSSTLDSTKDSIESKKQQPKEQSFSDQFASSSMASAAAVATAAVNAAVSMKSLEAPDTGKSYVTMGQDVEIDEEGLPLTYDKDAIQAYWKKERGALNKRWGEFVGKTVPFLTKLTTLFIRDGEIREEEIPALSRQARSDLQDLGPTFIKMGQMMSVRPDVLPPSTLEELQKLQDSVEPFPTKTAVEQIERELGGPLGQFFTSISEEPVAAASLAQVYLATLNDGNNTRVAVKVQRPDVLGTVSKDLYVLRRAAEVFNGLIQRFAPQQRTDYVALLNEWAIGFYTELDFQNEANNQNRLRQLLEDKDISSVRVPAVYDDLCTRRILVSEWIDGVKLSECTPEKIKAVTPAAQEAFLTQLFEAGFFHADPHPGNLLIPHNDTADIVLIDCGLMATIDESDRELMVSAVIHLANKNYAALVDDFIKLNILPADTNRGAVIPLMDKALTPYVKGGGAKKYEEELLKIYGVDETMGSKVGGFQAMTQDALTVLQDIPFSVPPYFAILGRAIVTLEGVALSGNPDYGIIMESYPFIARKLLQEGRPEIQKALYEVLYSNDRGSGGLKMTRLLALLNNAAGAVATQNGAAFVDLDTVPEDGLDLSGALKILLSDNASGLRNTLESEIDTMVDLLSRQLFRRVVSEGIVAVAPPRPPTLPFIGNLLPPPPTADQVPLPFVLPGPRVTFMSMNEFVDLAAPKLDSDEELYAISLADAARTFLGEDIGDLLRGDDKLLSPKSASLVGQALQSGVLAEPNWVEQSPAAKSARDFLVRSFEQRINNSDNQIIKQTMDSLSEEERTRLQFLVQEVTDRATKRLQDRLSS